MLRFHRSLAILAVMFVCAAAAGCAARGGVSDVRSATPEPQGDISSEDRPEPLTPGVKPLTLEQEEMISQ